MGFPLFKNIRNPKLRSFNRANIFMNIKERYGREVAFNYLRKINRKGQEAVFDMMYLIHMNGFEQTRRDLLRNGEI